MWNILLDKLPEEYEGYPINSDFRIGIQIFQAMTDSGLSDYEKLNIAADLLYSVDENQEIYPDAQTAQRGIIWFLTEWQTDKLSKAKENEKKDMDYDIDQWRIYSAFLTQFDIDLNKSDMHFWVFMGLLSNLEECAFTRIVDVRTKKIDPKMSQIEKKTLREVKERYSLDEVEEVDLSPEEKKSLDIFMNYAKARNKPDGE